MNPKKSLEKIFSISFFIYFITFIKNIADNSKILYIILFNSIIVVKIRIEKKYFCLLYIDCFFSLFLHLNCKYNK